jgi:hypothetical protein
MKKGRISRKGTFVPISISNNYTQIDHMAAGKTVATPVLED